MKQSLMWMGVIAFVFISCGRNDQSVEQQGIEEGDISFKTIQWVELIPPDDLDALLNPPSYIMDIEDGSLADQMVSQIQSSSEDRYQQALTSTTIMPEMDKAFVRVPGFIVPLAFNADQLVTQFFLVPYFGACIHVPPPPPNQIIFVDYPEGVELESWDIPFWFSGQLHTSFVENEMATSAYSLDVKSFEIYNDF